MPTISAPILIPGTQQMPTIPALRIPITSAASAHTMTAATPISPTSSASLIQLAGADNVAHLAATLGLTAATGNNQANSHHHHSSSSNTSSSTNTNTNNSNALKDYRRHTIVTNISLPMPTPVNNNDNENSGLRRLPTLGNIKRLTTENQAQRAKILELERYLWGLKEALILAREQVRSKDQEAKQAEERKAVEIHELGQHIQRCEGNLAVKAVECEALKNQLQHQSKEQISKLKHIRMLETEIREYRRMSIMSAGTIVGAMGSIGSIAESRASIRFSTDLTGNRASTIFGEGGLTTYEEIKQLKEENTSKEERLEELKMMIERMKTEKQSGAPPVPPPRPPRPPSAHMLFSNAGDACFPYIPPPPQAAIPPAPRSPTPRSPSPRFSAPRSPSPRSPSPRSPGIAPPPPAPRHSMVNTVGFNITEEHPKLLARNQVFESEIGQLKVEVNARKRISSANPNPINRKLLQPVSTFKSCPPPPLDMNALAVERSSSTSSTSSQGSMVSGASTIVSQQPGSPTAAVSPKLLRYAKDDMTTSPVELVERAL